MPDSKEYLHPEAIRRIHSMELRARNIVEGFLSGMHRSPYFGQSVEFVQHRQYAPGDDLRHIDWKVYGRQDRLYIKQYEEDTNLRCTLLVDASKSMLYGRGALNKFDYGATIAACLAYLTLRQQDSVGLSVFDEKIRTKLPWRSSRTHLQSIFKSLQQVAPKDKTNLAGVFREINDTYPKRSLMILITDFLGAEQDALKGLAQLRKAGHDILVFHVLDDDELDFPFNDPTRFEGMESMDNLTCNPRALRDGYMEALQRFLDRIRHACASYQVDYQLIRTSKHIDAALTAYLSARMAHMRKR
ncbi:MAG: DUF58 domain-containing protein [Pirellula sp.]|jgi:uncharacterized protein (DUF58 family)|nr:DUF58 domain-containing protein [Pirellula sp.]